MSLNIIKKLYFLLKTSDNMSEIRCNLHKYCDNINFEKVINDYSFSNDILMMIDLIKKEYDSMIEAEKTVYKISSEELDNRINKLKMINEVFLKTTNPYIRYDILLRLFKNPAVMHKSYNLLIKYGKNDPKLDEIRLLLHNLPIYLKEFRDGYKKDIHNTVVNAYDDENKATESNYALFIINEYIKSKDSYRIDIFLERYNINLEFFNKCINLIKKIDQGLYEKYLRKKSLNDILTRDMYIGIINDLAYAISNGQFIYGNRFDLLEFIKMIPFKDSDSFLDTLNEFMKIYNKGYIDLINNYINENNINKKDAFKIYDRDNLLSAKIIISGQELSSDDMEVITAYLIRRDIPLYKCAIMTACKMYLNKEFDRSILANDIIPMSKLYMPVIAPSLNKTKKTF